MKATHPPANSMDSVDRALRESLAGGLEDEVEEVLSLLGLALGTTAADDARAVPDEITG